MDAQPIAGENQASKPHPQSSKGANTLSLGVGVAIVVGCLLLPIVLFVLAANSEEAAAERAIRELQSSPAFVPASSDPNRPRIFDQHYYFVNGCVSAPLDCNKANAGTWDEY